MNSRLDTIEHEVFDQRNGRERVPVKKPRYTNTKTKGNVTAFKRKSKLHIFEFNVEPAHCLPMALLVTKWEWN